MIAKVVYVDAVFSDHIISTQAVFADSILQADADLINRITEGEPRLQEKEVTPTAEDQTVVYDTGYSGLSKVLVHAIPNYYGLITWDGSALTVS